MLIIILSRLELYQWSQFIEINLLKIRKDVTLFLFLLQIIGVHIFFVLREWLEISPVLDFGKVWDLVRIGVMVQDGGSFGILNQLISCIDFA